VKCEICKRREAVITYADEPFMAISHGFGKQEICRECFIYKIENHIEDCKKQIKLEKDLLLKERKNPEG